MAENYRWISPDKLAYPPYDEVCLKAGQTYWDVYDHKQPQSFFARCKVDIGRCAYNREETSEGIEDIFLIRFKED